MKQACRPAVFAWTVDMFSSALVACLVLTLGLGLGHLDVVFGGNGKHRLRYGQYDALFAARCEAHCWQLETKNQCVKSCLLKETDKPGSCPESDSFLSPFASVCMKICSKDTQCPGLSKCCQHNCGVTCQPAQNLHLATGLPEVPTDITVTEGRRKRTLYIEWRAEKSAENTVVLFVLEERHYIGRHFLESRMSEWTPCSRTSKTSQMLRRFVKPGRWYQFRVAAVNENGTKGYSENSLRFSISSVPKPPKSPQNVTVGPLVTINGSLVAELRWSPPHSDLPIQKYKVFWSRRLHGATALDSVLVHQQVVSREQTTFFVHDLQPNSLYFLQVQALAQFGKDRLKGEKSGLILNTTNFTNITDNKLSSNITSTRRIEGLHLQRLFWSQGDLRARVVWRSRPESVRYTVSWWSGPCHDPNSKGPSHFKLAATTKASHFDLYDLQFNCRYRTSVREVLPEGMKSMQDTSVTFTTPACDDFKRRNKKVRCFD